MATDRMRVRLRVSTAAVLSAFALAATAADEDLYFSELPIVASVSRLPQRLADAPGAVTVIDRTLIKASGARNFVDLLRLVPGFQVTPHNQEGGIVAYHGLSNEEYTPRVQVLLDGRSLYSPLFKSGVNWNLIPVALENIERIEVMRGANGVSYGSNALLGVINIITQDASQTHGLDAGCQSRQQLGTRPDVALGGARWCCRSPGDCEADRRWRFPENVRWFAGLV